MKYLSVKPQDFAAHSSSHKAHILNRRLLNQLFDHILDGFEKSEQGIEQAYQAGVLNKEEYINLLKLNAERLITRVRDFKIVNRIISFTFAAYFTLMQVQGSDLDMRKPSRSGRRRSETETITTCLLLTAYCLLF